MGNLASSQVFPRIEKINLELGMETEVETLQHECRIPLCLYMLRRITGARTRKSLTDTPLLDGPDT